MPLYVHVCMYDTHPLNWVNFLASSGKTKKSPNFWAIVPLEKAPRVDRWNIENDLLASQRPDTFNLYALTEFEYLCMESKTISTNESPIFWPMLCSRQHHVAKPFPANCSNETKTWRKGQKNKAPGLKNNKQLTRPVDWMMLFGDLVKLAPASVET